LINTIDIGTHNLQFPVTTGQFEFCSIFNEKPDPTLPIKGLARGSAVLFSGRDVDWAQPII
jgi:hypothetical protein